MPLRSFLESFSACRRISPKNRVERDREREGEKHVHMWPLTMLGREKFRRLVRCLSDRDTCANHASASTNTDTSVSLFNYRSEIGWTERITWCCFGWLSDSVSFNFFAPCCLWLCITRLCVILSFRQLDGILKKYPGLGHHCFENKFEFCWIQHVFKIWEFKKWNCVLILKHNNCSKIITKSYLECTNALSLNSQNGLQNIE